MRSVVDPGRPAPRDPNKPGAGHHVWLRTILRGDAQDRAHDLSEVAARLETQWRGPVDCEILLERAASGARRAVDAVEILSLLRTDVGPLDRLERTWVEAQLACQETSAGRFVGARVALAPEHHEWRVYVAIPYLGMAFPSGKLNESAVGALASATSRFLNRGQREGGVA